MKLFGKTEIKNNAYGMKDLLSAEIEKVEDLETVYSCRKSFYSKAQVISLVNGAKVLMSYNTYVAAVLPDGKYVQNGVYSATTNNHEIEFAQQFAGHTAGKEYNLGVAFY